MLGASVVVVGAMVVGAGGAAASGLPPPSAAAAAMPTTADGYLVEEMAPKGVEMILGGFRHPRFGPVLMVGVGGVLVELLGDVAFRVCPLDRSAAAAMLDDLKAARLLDGYRVPKPLHGRRTPFGPVPAKLYPLFRDREELSTAHDLSDRIKAALSELRPEQQQVIDLSIFRGLSHREISSELDLPLGTVKTHVRRGLMRVREMLGEDPA